MRLYQRIFELVVGESDSAAVRLANLQFKFQIKKVSASKPIEGFVEVINLSDATDTFIKNKGQRVRVFAGYPGQTGLIFDGDIRSIIRGRDGVDRVTNIKLGGNVLKMTQARFSKSYSGNVSIRQIITDAIPSFGLTVESLDLLPEIQKADFAFDGRTSDLLDRLLLPNGIGWHESDGIIVFSIIGKANGIVTFPVITARSGLVGIPGQTEKKGIKFTSLLNPFLAIGKPVRIESDVLGLPGGGRAQNLRSAETSGVYKITTITHRGETRGVPFYTDVEGIPV